VTIRCVDLLSGQCWTIGRIREGGRSVQLLFVEQGMGGPRGLMYGVQLWLVKMVSRSLQCDGRFTGPIAEG